MHENTAVRSQIMFKRRRLLAFQISLLGVVSVLVFRHTVDFRATGQVDIPGSPIRKRQLIGDNAAVADLTRAGLDDTDKDVAFESLTQSLIKETEDRAISMFPDNATISSVVAHPTTSPAGGKPTFFYRFTNIRIAKDGSIDFFTGGVDPKPRKAWYNVVTGNSTSPNPPATLLLEDHQSSTSSRTKLIRINYHAGTRPENDAVQGCSKWIDSPSLLLHIPRPTDMWSAWSQGLIPTFQTLRELGYLPLMEVDTEGKVEELNAGIVEGECPVVIDPGSGVTRPATDCTQRRPIREQWSSNYCSTKDTWCMLGVWPHIAHLRTPHPVLLYSSEAVVDSAWGVLFSSMAGGGLYSWDEEAGMGNTCVRNLIVGYTRTLSFENQLPISRGEIGAPAEVQERMSAALDAFSKFTRAGMHRLEINNAVEFLGYNLSSAERLRKGIALGEGRYIDLAFKPYKAREVAGANAGSGMSEDWMILERTPWLFGATRDSLTPKEAVSKIATEAAHASMPSPLGTPETHEIEKPLPVVTYISRWGDLDAAILNDRQVLRYMYWRYNVTLRVTTLQEHEGAAADILRATDVLIGPAGPHWSHAVFLKPGAVSLQLLPYGWRLKDGSLLSGGEVAPLIHLRRGTHLDWVNPYPEYSFFRLYDFADEITKDPDSFRQHPTTLGGAENDTTSSTAKVGEVDSDELYWSSPAYGYQGNANAVHPAWLHANTYADLNHLGAYIDEVMRLAGVEKMDPAVLSEVAAAEQQIELASMYAGSKQSRSSSGSGRGKHAVEVEEEVEEEEEEEGNAAAAGVEPWENAELGEDEEVDEEE